MLSILLECNVGELHSCNPLLDKIYVNINIFTSTYTHIKLQEGMAAKLLWKKKFILVIIARRYALEAWRSYII